MDALDRNALGSILQTMKSNIRDVDPGGETDWIAALGAWTIDEHERIKKDDPVKLAKDLSTIWEVGNLVEKELNARFQIRATQAAQFPYVSSTGELKGGVVDSHKLHLISQDPREIACAIAAEVVNQADPEHNAVLFRRLVYRTALYSSPLQYAYHTSFGLARVK